MAAARVASTSVVARTARADPTGPVSVGDFCAPYDAPTPLMRDMSERSRNVRAGVRVGCAALLGLIVGGVVSQYTSWQASILIGWDAAALVLNVWIWVAVLGLDAKETESHAGREDTSRSPVGGIDFNEDDPPTYLDFAYLALTIAMTFQVSDTNLTTKSIRRIALAHALLSYLYGAVIIALVINVVSSLLH
jgi:uncharacterized membrane protein